MFDFAPNLRPLVGALGVSLLPILATAQTDDASPRREAGRGVTVRMLANEGFLLSSEATSVVIDGFLAEPYSIYGALPATILDDLLAARAPFEDVTLALASHYHGDHFQPAPAALFLEAHPECLFASSPQVLAALAASGGPAAASARTFDAFPAQGETTTLERDGVRVEFLNLSHGTGRFAKVQNMGHVITLGGVTLLHVGDAAMVERNFAPYALSERGIDVAFIPYWYFADPSGRALVSKHLPNAELIACHIPPKELVDVTASLKRDFPNVTVFERALASRAYRRPAGAPPEAPGSSAEQHSRPAGDEQGQR